MGTWEKSKVDRRHLLKKKVDSEGRPVGGPLLKKNVDSEGKPVGGPLLRKKGRLGRIKAGGGTVAVRPARGEGQGRVRE
jgi:hypothetical protein